MSELVAADAEYLLTVLRAINANFPETKPVSAWPDGFETNPGWLFSAVVVSLSASRRALRFFVDADPAASESLRAKWTWFFGKTTRRAISYYIRGNMRRVAGGRGDPKARLRVTDISMPTATCLANALKTAYVTGMWYEPVNKF